MSQLLRIVGVAFLAASMTACINVSTVIKVNLDGSGFIEETVLVRTVVMEQFRAMVQGIAEGFGAPEPGTFELPGLFDEASLQTKARQYGEGVEYISGEKLQSETGEGYRAVYHFSDINLLELDQNPSGKMGDSPLSSLGSVPKQFLTFQFQRGIPNTLVVRTPEGSPETQSSDAWSTDGSASLSEAAPEMLAMFQSFFRDMRIALSLDIQGSITGTNATHRDGSEITVMELDLGELLEDPNVFSALQNAQITSLEDAQSLLQDIPGIKIDLNDELVIQFQ